VAVKKAYGKIKPDIQNEGGDPEFIHLLQKFMRSRSSVIQEARGFKDKKPFSAQDVGT